jgi:hypothetical protein
VVVVVVVGSSSICRPVLSTLYVAPTAPFPCLHPGPGSTGSSCPLLDCTTSALTAFLAAVQAGPPGVDGTHAAIRTLAEAVGRPCLGASAPDDAETARRCHAVAAVALPWIVSVLDVQGGSSSALTQDALVLLLLAWRHRHTDSDFEDGDEAVLTQIANSIVRMLDAHGRDAGVVEAGLALLAELAKVLWLSAPSQVRGHVFWSIQGVFLGGSGSLRRIVCYHFERP